MAKIEASSDSKDAARAGVRDERYQEVEDLARGMGRYADDAWYAGRTLVGETCGLLSQFVVACGRVLAPRNDYTFRRDGRYGTDAATGESRTDTKAT